jgi:hypothetical protein
LLNCSKSFKNFPFDFVKFEDLVKDTEAATVLVLIY